MTEAKRKIQSQDILFCIEQHHRKLEALFEEIESAENHVEIQEFFQDIYRELTIHTRSEELVFYPALREYEETAQYISEAEQEHHSVKILLEQMKMIGAEAPEFEVKLSYLTDTMLHHIEEEEEEIFETVRECIDNDVLMQLGTEFQEAQIRLIPEVEALMTG